MANIAGRAVLGVEKSLTGRSWRQRLDQAGLNRASAMAEAHDLPELVCRVLAGRGVTIEEAAEFLEPTIRRLMPDPMTLTDMGRATDRLVGAIIAGERVAIFGDYDVDGAASSALMKRFLDHFGVPTEIYIPDRIFEGYGPNPAAIATLVERGASLIVTVDCGSTSFESLDEAARLGVDVVVIDHHQVADVLPACHALVNPNREDDLSGQGHLCAAGIVFLVLVAVLGRLRAVQHPGHATIDLLGLLDLVALATVCDVVPLKGLNRAYVTKGLIAARAMGNAGLKALVRSAGIGAPLAPQHFGFLIGPRINAGGRIGDAALGSRLLTLTDEAEAEAIAAHLETLNRERQAMEKTMLEQAEAEALAEYAAGAGPSVIVTANAGWHPGIVGLIAARLKEKLRRPAIAIAFDASGKGQGSGRSITGFDLGRVVREALEAQLLVKGGGHAMAAGLTIERNRLGEFRSFLEERSATRIAQLTANHILPIEGALSASAARFELVEMIESAGPYGAGHSQPVFALPRHRLVDARVVGTDHLKLSIAGADGGRIDAIAFRSADSDLGRGLLAGRGSEFHFAGTLCIESWQGRQRVQLRLTDAAPVA